MTKKSSTLIILVIILAVAAIALGIIFFWPGEKPNDNANDSENLNLSYGEYVEYNESFGKTCPLGVKFLGAKDAPEIGCECPDGYEFESNIIGYSGGDSCYGAGTECPIMGSTCVQIAP